MHKVIATCHEVKRELDNLQKMKREYSGIFVPSETPEIRVDIDTMESFLRARLLKCTPGGEMGVMFKDLAERHFITNPPDNWPTPAD